MEIGEGEARVKNSNSYRAALSAMPLIHADMPRFPALRRYVDFSTGVQRSSTLSEAGFLMGGLPRFGAFMGLIMPVQKRVDKPLLRPYSVRTLNTEA